jgi:hypothetical protein
MFCGFTFVGSASLTSFLKASTILTSAIALSISHAFLQIKLTYSYPQMPLNLLPFICKLSRQIVILLGRPLPFVHQRWLRFSARLARVRGGKSGDCGRTTYNRSELAISFKVKYIIELEVDQRVGKQSRIPPKQPPTPPHILTCPLLHYYRVKLCWPPVFI